MSTAGCCFIHTCIPSARLGVSPVPDQTGKPSPWKQSALLLQLPAVSGYVSALTVHRACFYDLVGSSTLLGSLTHQGGKTHAPRLQLLACFLRVINAARGVYFHLLGGGYECLRCHCPLTCPAGWKGFFKLIHHTQVPSNAEEERGAGGGG